MFASQIFSRAGAQAPAVDRRAGERHYPGVWDVHNRDQCPCLTTFVVTAQPRGALHLAFAPDGQTLAVATLDKGVYLFNTTTWQERGRIPLRGVWAVAFAPDGRTLALTGRAIAPIGQPGPAQAATILWDLAGHRERGRFQQGSSCGGSTVAYAPDGQTLAIGHDGVVTLLHPAALPPAAP